MIENSGLIKVGVSQEDLEESIAGLRENERKKLEL